MEHADIVHRCFRCGYCKFPSDYVDFNCPSHKAFGWDTFSSGGRMWLIRAWLSGEIETSPRFAQILFSCVACGNCEAQCVYPRFKDFLLNIFEETKSELVDEGKIPPTVRDYFKAITVNGNPYKLPQDKRGEWSEGMGIEEFSGQEYLFYVGCVGSYDEVGREMARSVGKLLKDLGVSFGILGAEETCDGNEVKVLGEKGLFTALAEENIIKFKAKGVKKIVTLDPHALNVFRREYPKLGGAFQVRHYTEVVADAIGGGRTSFGPLKTRVTYHDPCYLGRRNLIFEPPREVLRAVPGLDLVEMRRWAVDSFCCGGGGGNFFTDVIGTGEQSPARVRVREALETGAEVLAVACPQCAKMLVDGVKAEGIEDRLEVMDIAQLLSRAGLA
ncbi:MAG: (Fe-S)-binding protein [Deltaproteobacteria bacterium]|nr:(Fe-S)-binding protein [Deltaproteobacteria bacterium]MBW1923794.1 (Fe-S)-binding protein [Deltaproteobacteria bacterium]RLB40459.1 MAG: (Fe-S)-binding protein [Deltaproteobacteria bacterium]